MADRPDPDDTNDRHKNELILRWLEDVQTANQQVPRVSIYISYRKKIVSHRQALFVCLFVYMGIHDIV